MHSPERRRTWSGVTDKVDDIDICAIKRKVYELYGGGERVTLDTILAKVRDDLHLDISRTSLRKLLYSLV